MPTETMTPRERWMAVLQRQKPDRVPMSFRATSELCEKMRKFLKCADHMAMCERLHIDPTMIASPRYAGPALPAKTDIWGVELREVQYGTGSYEECANHPLAAFENVEDIERNYKWPTADLFDFSVLPKQAQGWEKYPVFGGGSEPFLTYKYLRGDQQAFLDLLVNPEIVHYCMEKMYGFAYDVTQRILETIPGVLTHVWVAEDLGSQEDLMYSPEQIREYFFPHMRRMVESAHDAGAFVFHHSDGAVRKILPGLIDVGMDALDPIQWRCTGMQREGLKRDFGDKLVFHGGLDNQKTLPFGSVEDVRQEAIDNLRILGAGGGFIFGPCHNIQPVTPPENVVAMYETGYECGWVQ